jgi:hypothetical protein
MISRLIVLSGFVNLPRRLIVLSGFVNLQWQISEARRKGQPGRVEESKASIGNVERQFVQRFTQFSIL